MNKFGLAFQANYYNWPGETRVARQDPTRYLPVSTITTFSYDHDQTQRQESAALRSFEIFASSGLDIGRAHGGGFYAHAFHRWGYASAGIIGYLHKDANQIGLVGTYAVRNRLFLTGVAVLAHEPGFNTPHVSVEPEYLFNRRLAVSARGELISGNLSEFSSGGAINYYPFQSSFVRLSAEAVQRRQARDMRVTLRVQY